MPWTRVTSLAGNTFEGASAEEHFVRNSALILTLRAANDGTHYLVNTAEYRASDDTVLLTFNFVTTGTEVNTLDGHIVADQDNYRIYSYLIRPLYKM